MQTQTLTQTITILVGDTTNGRLAETGISLAAFIGVSVMLIVAAILLYRFATRCGVLRSISSFRNLGIFVLLALGLISLALNLSTVSAAPALILASNQSNLTITIPKGGGKATTTTTMTTSTANATGYTLTASLEAEEPGIGIALKGGSVATSTPLTASASPLTLATTTDANISPATDATNVELSFTIDVTVTEGTKELKLIYAATDNDPAGLSAPLTMQTMTQDYCTNSTTIYDGTNEDAILTLADNRGATPADYRTYRIAKLADNKCWMLDNLKLGSTTGTTTLTSADSNVSSNFTLPQVQTGGSVSYDTPTVSGPVPGDTGSGATNYGYLYNWSAATAGETRTSITTGNAAHSICAKGWRLPVGGNYNSGVGEFADLDRAFGGTGMYAYQGPSQSQWLSNGPFKAVFAGFWWEGFDDQGDWGYLWSSSAYPGWSDNVFVANFNADDVYPGNGSYRGGGFGVRCLLD